MPDAEGAVESGEDRDSLDRVLQKRRRVSEQYFNLIAGKLGKNYCPGRSWEAIGHLAGFLVKLGDEPQFDRTTFEATDVELAERAVAVRGARRVIFPPHEISG